MSLRCPDLPFLPGYSVNPNVGKTEFHLNPIFGFIGEGNRALIEKVKPNMFGPLSDKFPSIYPRGQCTELPGWIMFDKQILCFDAFFQETLQEVRGSPFQVRNVKIYYFLEDGTIQVIEPRVENSGVSQGTLISRQRIRFPSPMDFNFYDVMDFNIGREVEFYGRVLKITNCDKFTRTFLNRCGISVPDPIVGPGDPYMELRSHDKDAVQPKKPNRTKDSLGKFLENDRKVLHFKAYWDDQNTEYGYLHYLELRYYLADDTIEIKELQSESGGEPGFLFLRRAKLPKRYKELPAVGGNANYTILNVLGSALSNRRYIVDPLDCGRENIQYYDERDLSIGGVINCYGRKLVLTDCDAFTKEYYATKYGISEFTPISEPARNKETVFIAKPKERDLPPWNGFGSYEDSAQNCITVEPKAPHKNFKKFLSYDRAEVQLPGQKIFTSKPPLSYTPQHMFIGATLIINGFKFVLVEADEYALRYMEINCGQFPKANLKRIMDNVREKLKPIYKDFVAENIPKETSVISYSKLREKLCRIMGQDFTEHEMITIARGFSATIALTELKRFLWDDLERLREYFLQTDHSKSGKLSKKECYTVLKGARLPFDNELLEKILEVIKKDDDCNLNYEEILQFLDRSICAPPDEPPTNVKNDLWWGSEPQPEAGKLIDWCAFNKYLDLESTFRDTIEPNSIIALESSRIYRIYSLLDSNLCNY
ncbi:hypothetical protein HUJ04_002970 [Dendroctonus ponderosae]|nr:hypothetical protein HUJ04_002970 [Dendroctonus ponderosae]KAH1024032.1 hypothetical protein HUJ05_003597 [Dendroctonus ponderosae]